MNWIRVNSGPLLIIVACLLGGATTQGQGRGGLTAFLGNPSRLINIPEVLIELKVEDEQKELLDALEADLDDQRAAILEDGQRRPANPRAQIEWLQLLRSQVEDLDRRGEQLIAIVLEPDQADRLAELRLQREGPRAFRRPELLEKLEVNAEQREAIADILDSSTPFRPIISVNQLQERLAKQEADILAVMSDEQKAKWKELQGESFQFPRRGRFGRRRNR